MSCMLALGFLSASAQDQQPKTEYVFNPHWYVQIQPLGLQHTLGEVDFGDLNSYNVQATIGRQFSPVFGLRLAVNGWQSKAGSEILNDKYLWDWKYIAPSLDLTVNLSNALCGYNPNRVFNLGVFLGGGANIGFSNDKAADQQVAMGQKHGVNSLEYLWDGSKIRPFAQGGITADFRLSDAISFGIEVSANTVSDKYNSKKADNWDWYFNALAGLKINLGSTYTTRVIPAPEPEIRYVEKVVEKVVEVPAPVQAPAIEPIRRDVFFKINSFKIQDSEAGKVKDIADYLNKYPNAKVVVTGYADAVVKALKEKYSIAADRISYDSKGARVQPFAENDMNRVSICIAE